MSKFRESISEDSGEQQIDISPLIDCVFILLIFFIVTTIFVEERGVQVDKPQAASASESEKESVLFVVTPRNEVMYEGKDIGIAGVQPTVRRIVTQEDLPVVVQVEEGALAGIFVQVIDQAKLAGATKVSVANK